MLPKPGLITYRSSVMMSAWRANPCSELKKERYEDVKISLHKAEAVVNTLAAAASTSGVHFWLAVPVKTHLA